jgi:quercetin dioxygenase-like cupin family protein
MPRIQQRLLVTSCLVLGGLLAAACSPATPATQATQAGKEVLHVDSRTAVYKELVPGVTTAVAWGDADTGPHGTFTKFTPGYTAALHTHTNDIRIVVLEGAYLYRPENGQEQRIAAGQFLFVPGGDRHSSGGDAKQGALFYNESTGKFDLNFVK